MTIDSQHQFETLPYMFDHLNVLPGYSLKQNSLEVAKFRKIRNISFYFFKNGKTSSQNIKGINN